MGDILFYLFMLLMLLAAIGAGVFVLRGYMTGSSPTLMLFGPRPEKRLAVVDQANVDGRRRLVLIRRDGVEHLIMTGGPIDMVIETGIGPQSPQPQAGETEGVVTEPTLLSRAARVLRTPKNEEAAE
jgi:hypothetical protein